eukprot:g4274.t1
MVGGGLQELSVLISVFSVGRLISSPIFGSISEKCSFRTAFWSSLSTSVLANCLYCLPASETLLTTYKMRMGCLIVSRFLCGFGAGNRAVCRANLAHLTNTGHERLKWLTILQMTVYIGYAITPGIAEILPFSSGTNSFSVFNGALSIDEFTMPGITLVLANALVILLFAFFYDELQTCIPLNEEPKTIAQIDLKGGKIDRSDRNDDEGDMKNLLPDAVLPTRILNIGFWLFLSLNLLAKGILSIFETVSPLFYLQVTQQQNGSNVVNWSTSEQISIFLLVLGIIGFLPLGFMVYNKGVSEHIWNSSAFFLISFGTFATAFLVFQPSLPLLVVSELLVWSIGAPIAGASVISTFSHIVGGGGKPQGLAMGWIGSAGSAGRIFAPPIFAAAQKYHSQVIFLIVLGLLSFLGASGVLRFQNVVKRWRATHKETSLSSHV